jgi:photosystem II stability/assembly factor-like uncharacterized protein
MTLKRTWLAGVVICLGAAPMGWAQGGPDRRLDPLLRLLTRPGPAARSTVLVREPLSTQRALEILGRVDGRRAIERTGVARRLSLLVQYNGERSPLEQAGFRVQARVGNIYTGTLEADRLDDLLALPGVLYVQGSRELLAPPAPRGEALRLGQRRERALQATSPARSLGALTNAPGQGVLVAFVDTGVDITHEDFRKADGTTRIQFLLDLSDPGDTDGDGELDGPGPFGGTLYTAADIDAALLASGTVAEKDTTGHGTHGLSIAAGDDPALPGLAPGADLIVVKATREDGSLGFQSVDVIDALSFVDQKAAELGRPYVVNLSLGTLFSSHDGRSLEEQAIDALFGPGIPGKAVVIAAGNSSENGTTRYHHFQGTAYVGLASSHTLTVPAYTPNPGQGDDRVLLDLWYEGRDEHRLTVTGPGCSPVTAVYGDYADVATPCGDVFIANMGGANPANGDTEAVILIDDWSGTAPAVGAWTITLEGQEIGATGVYHGWLADESALGSTSPYLATGDNLFLVGKPGTAYNAVTVASFAKHDPASRYRITWTDVNGIGRTDTSATNGDISDFSSPGKTRDGRTKPEVAAPGERVLGAVSKDAYPGVAPNSIYRFHPFPEADALITENIPQHAFGVLQGTSFSGPVVTGLVARILETNPNLDAIQVRNVLVNSALADGFTGAVPNDLWGYGKAELWVGSPPLPENLRITVDGLPAAVKDRQYNAVLTASGGTLPYAWSIVAGSPPPGLALEAGGLLTGTPTAAGPYGFTVQVKDASIPVQTNVRDYDLTVAAQPALRILTTTLPNAPIDKPYQTALEAEGATPPCGWTLVGGSLPAGLSLNVDGTIDGTPTIVGRSDFTVRLTDAVSGTAYRSLRIKVTSAGGEDWEALGKSAPTISALAVDPNDPAHLAASTRNIDAVFESTNGGDSWRPLSINNDFNGFARFLAFSPVSSRLWASRDFTADWPNLQPSGPFSFDAGTGRWSGTCPSGQDWMKCSFPAFDPSDNAYVYYDGRFDNLPALYRSGDAGLTWTRLGVLSNTEWGNSYVRGSNLSISRLNPNVLYASRYSGAHTLTSRDGGATWSVIVNGSNGYMDIQVSQLDPLGLDVVKADWNAVLERSLDGGRNWEARWTGGTGTTCCMARSDTSPSVILYGTGDALHKSTDRGTTWSRVPFQGTDLPVTAIAIDPSNAETFWVGTSRGLLRSTDGGASWQTRNTSLVRRTLGGIAVSPGDSTAVAISAAEGPYVSHTAGDAWIHASYGIPSPAAARIAIGADPRLLYVGSNDGVYRSENGGVTWSLWTDPTSGTADQARALDADPVDSSTVLVGLDGSKGVYRSTDRGATWTGVNAGLPFFETTDLAFARDMPGRVYLGFTSSGIYRSENRGDTWAPFGLNSQTVNVVKPAPSNSAYVYAASGATAYFLDPAVGSWMAATTSPAHAILALAVDANDPMTAYAGVDHPGTGGETGGIYQTTDGGRSWTRLEGVLDSLDVVSLATHPTQSGSLWAATLNGGVYRSTDGGTTWTELGNYGTVADLTNVNVPDPSNPLLLFAGTEGFGVQASADAGRTYVPRVAGLTNYYVNAIAFDPATPSTLYAASDSGIFKSTDSGGAWAPTGLASGEVTDLLTDDEGTVRRIWGTVRGQGVAYSADGGATFAVYSSGLSSLDLTSLELELVGSVRRIWGTARGGDGVFYSDDLGRTWVSGAGNGLGNRNVHDLAIETGSARRIWATTDNGVFYSDNAGLSWTDLSLGLPSGIPATSVSVDPNTGEVLVSLFSATGGGVYRGGSLNGVWTPFNSGLGELKVRRLTRDRGHAIDAATRATTFYAATAGDGVYSTEIRSTEGQPPAITTAQLRSGLFRDPYLATLAAQGGKPPYAWSLQAGALPSGLRLEAATGAISGQPQQTGLFAFTAQVSDAGSRTGKKALSIEILPADTPRMTIADVSITEGNAGSTNAVFTVSLSAAAGRDVSVSYATADGTAQGGSDYTATTGRLTIAARATSGTIAVPVRGDATPETNEIFFVNLSSPTGAALDDTQAVGTILNDDAFPTPSLVVGDATVIEGDAGTRNAVFTVSLSPPAASAVTVDYATANGTAVAGTDYTAVSGQLTFPAGETTRTVTVAVEGDTLDENDETFFVNLTNATHALVADAQGRGTVTDDDPLPALVLGDCAATEGTSGTTPCTFTVALSPASGRLVTVDFATADATSTAGSDYAPATGTVTFAPGVTAQTVAVAVKGDTLDEPNETFFLNLFNPVSASLADGQGLGSITDDDPTPAVSIGDGAVNEGDTGTVDALFEVSLSATSGKTVTVQYATVNGTALSGLDYVGAGGSLTFPPGVTRLVLPIQVKGDWLPEPDETFFVMLSNPGNAALGDAEGQGTIRDDDAHPGLGFYTVTPCRLVDTRGPDGPALAAGESRAFLVGGLCSIPTSAKAISVNLTVTGATAAGNLALYPGGASPPSASAINYGAGQTRANNAILALGPSADLIAKCNQGSGNVHFVLDVNGYFR